MGFKCGIVGLPNVGKSTLFNALTNSSKAQAENFPFCTIDPNIGVVPVPDKRLEKLVSISNSTKKIHTTISFVDIAGLVKGASKGEGLGNKFLSHIREVDAIIHMIRCFDSDDIQNVNPNVDPIRDLEIIETEMKLADLDSIEKRLDKKNKKNLDENLFKILEKAKQLINNDNDLNVLYDEYDEKENYMEMIGLKRTGLNMLIQKGYSILELDTYFTSGLEETRAWTIQKNCTAPKAAGEIHTDFEKGFIRAETISYKDFIANEGWLNSKINGKMRLEGKDYIVKDGDILNFRFNT